MNKVALQLLKWIKEKVHWKDSDYHKLKAREYWERYGEKVIKKAMNQKACVSISEFERLCKYYKNEI